MDGVNKRQKVPGSGRKKGSLNKRTALFKEVLERNNFDPAQELIDLLEKSSQLKDRDKAMILLEMLQYEHPKKKAVEFEDKTPPDQRQTFVLKWADENETDNASATAQNGSTEAHKPVAN